VNFVKVPNYYFEASDTHITLDDWGAAGMGAASGPFPVVAVNYDDVQPFLAALNAKNDGYQYFLPTKKELKVMARCGAQTDYPWGNDQTGLAAAAWFAGNATALQPVKTKAPNAWGLYDTLGNCYSLSRSFADPNLLTVVVRGGSYLSQPQNLTMKKFINRSDRFPDVGFRLIRVPTTTPPGMVVV
jgi:formylglycine-generating enzyme required for sulfatase activity